jgi:NAD+ synthase
MKKKIVSWLKKEVRLAKAKGIVLGLSGGVDSCVVASLAKEAVGRGKVLGLILPIHSHSADAKDAKIVAGKLRLPHKTVDLTRAYDLLLKTFPKAGALARINLKPRLRMLTLYYFANKLNYLVCGTGNKAEIMVGYFTKHGDGAADLLPIGALLKRQVRALAGELGIPAYIIEKPPTAGLWPGQTDEGEMGILYPELDDILERLENKKKQVLSLSKVGRVKAMILRSEHKRIKPKICQL